MDYKQTQNDAKLDSEQDGPYIVTDVLSNNNVNIISNSTRSIIINIKQICLIQKK